MMLVNVDYTLCTFLLYIFLLGNYICEVESEAEPIKQTNTLQILGKSYNISDCLTPKKKLNKRKIF